VGQPVQPANARDFLKIAIQRLTAAEEILDKTGLTLEAQYIGGYSVECSLKALILDKTTEVEQPKTLALLTQGALNHRPEVLLQRLRELGVSLSTELSKRMRRFDWTTNLRYESGRKDFGGTNALLSTARRVYDWVQEQIK